MNDDDPMTKGPAEKALKRINDNMRETQRLASKFDVQHASSIARQAEVIHKSLTNTSIATEIHRTLNSPLNQAMAQLASEQLKLHQPALQQLKEALRLYEDRFTGPDASLVAIQVAKLNAHPLAHLALPHQAADGRNSALLEAIANATSHRHLIDDRIKQLRSNWIDSDNPERSVRAFIRIADLNATIRGYQSFIPEVAQNLRDYLGDWRDPISFRKEADEDIILRTAIYEEHGVDTSLTDFPDPAYVEILDATGLSNPIDELEQEYGEDFDAEYTKNEADDLTRTNLVQRRLTLVEISLRRFIDHHMSAQFGLDWPKRQLPNGYYEGWVEKQNKALAAGEARHPLIDYADFTEYQHIICKKDNWKQVFQPFFLRPESVRETFQRLHYTRLDAMHSRIIDSQAEFLMYAETIRIFNAIRKRQS